METQLEIELDALYSDAPEWEISLLRAGGRRLIQEWLDREFLSREIWPKSHSQGKTQFGEPGLRDQMTKDRKLRGSVAGLSRLGPYKIVHLVEGAAPQVGGRDQPLTERDLLYYGLHLLAAYEKEAIAAVEVESMGDQRTLMVLSRSPSFALSSRQLQGLKVVDLATSEDPSFAQKSFYEEVKEHLATAGQRITDTEVRVIKGDHCSACDYGELCRRSLEYGEEDSPFGDDFTAL